MNFGLMCMFLNLGFRYTEAGGGPEDIVLVFVSNKTLYILIYCIRRFLLNINSYWNLITEFKFDQFIVFKG